MPQENIQKIHFDNQLEQNYQQQSFARGSSLIHRKYNEDDVIYWEIYFSITKNHNAKLKSKG